MLKLCDVHSTGLAAPTGLPRRRVFRLACGWTTLMLYVGGAGKAIVRQDMPTIADVAVPDVAHKNVIPFVALT